MVQMDRRWRYWLLLIITALVCCGLATAKDQEATGHSCATDEIVSAPDRPNTAASADVTQCGVVELEYGWTRQWFGAGFQSDGLNSKIRFGLLRDLDVRISADDFTSASGAGRTESGFGDTSLGLRYRLVRQSANTPAIAVLYGVKLATADPRNGLGSGYADHSVALAVSKDIRLHHLDFNVVRQYIGSDSGFNHAAALALAYSRPVTGRLGVLAEFSGYVQPASNAIGTFVLTYRLRPRLVFDSGVDFGMTSGAPRKRLLMGVTYAIGNMYGKRPAAAKQTTVNVSAGRQQFLSQGTAI